MSTETTTEAAHTPAKAHNGSHGSHTGMSSGDHKMTRRAKPKVKAGKRVSKRHSNAQSFGGRVGHLADSLSLGSLSTSALDGFTEQLTELKERGVQTAEVLEGRIVKHPKSSLLLAFGVGYLYARLRRWL